MINDDFVPYYIMLEHRLTHKEHIITHRSDNATNNPLNRLAALSKHPNVEPIESSR